MEENKNQFINENPSSDFFFVTNILDITCHIPKNKLVAVLRK